MVKKIFTIIGFMSLVAISFIYTEKIANLVIEKDELMQTIKKVSSEKEIEAIDATIKNNTIIPGINGTKVDEKASYKAMKKYGIYNDNLLEFVQTTPKNKLNKNYDKYIISSNPNRKSIGLIFLVYKNTNIDNIINILDEKQVKASFFIDGYFLENNNEKVVELIKNGHTIGNLSYNLDYNDGGYIWMDTIIRKIGKQKQGYCYAEEENEQNLQICAFNKNYTIKPTIVIKDNYLINLKNNLTPGSIISLNVNKNLETELPVFINFIHSRGYKIESLNDLLKEER